MQLTITHLTDKGFGRALLEDSSKIELLGVLPDEVVEIELNGRRRGVKQAKLLQIILPSPYRILPKEIAYTATAPLAITTREYEQQLKTAWIKEKILEQGITLSDFDYHDSIQEYGYRNKIEYSFFSDEIEQLFLAFHQRGMSKGKVVVEQTLLASEPMNESVTKVLMFLRERTLRAYDLKSLIVRGTTKNQVVICIYCKEKNLVPFATELQKLLDTQLVGLVWVYSDHKAPDSRISEVQLEVGNTILAEQIGNLTLNYPWHGFFQVNPDAFASTNNTLISQIQLIPNHTKLKVLDLYAGVGTLGLCIAPYVESVHGVELSDQSKIFALQNAQNNHIHNYTFDQVASEEIDYKMICQYDLVIVDPPRPGLSQTVVDQLLLAKPKYIFYLSCNPATQARDLAQLLEHYTLDHYSAYNYYPRTMHIEGLAILKLKA
jgi:23S rRNA (uracil1939-C5)-methyltransferase